MGENVPTKSTNLFLRTLRLETMTTLGRMSDRSEDIVIDFVIKGYSKISETLTIKVFECGRIKIVLERLCLITVYIEGKERRQLRFF